MRKSTLLLAGLIGFSSWALAMETDLIELPANFDALNLNFKLPLDKLPAPGNAASEAMSQSAMRPVMRKSSAVNGYIAAAQKYHSGYTFVYEGGDITSYEIGIKVDGDVVTISNLFNLAAQTTDLAVGIDYDIEGKYDAETNTIKIPTPENFADATIAGLIGDYYTEVLVCGEVNNYGQMKPAEELIFNVEGEFESITTDMSFGIMNYTNDGSMAFGMQMVYRKFYANIPGSEPKLICFNENKRLSDTYAGSSTTSQITIVNMSNVSVDYAADMDSDEDAFSVIPDVGTVEPCAMSTFDVSFSPAHEGEYEGLLVIEYEGDEKEPEPITVQYLATAVNMPDYSVIVKEGDFKFDTNIDFPFEIATIEDGTTVARSTTNGRYGSSMLQIDFEVPEGKIGSVSWNGMSINKSAAYNNSGGYFIDTIEEPAATFSGVSDISAAIDFAPGKHFIRFQYDSYTNYNNDPANSLYVYNIALNSIDPEDDALYLETSEINLENMLIMPDDEYVETQGNIVLVNRGSNPLSVINVYASNKDNFVVTKPSSSVGLLQKMEIPVLFKTSEGGEYSSEIKVETSAGEVTAIVSAKVREMPDFSSVIVNGSEYVTSVTTNSVNPFLVENGVAYNANAGEADAEATESWFEINFTVPEGKAGFLTWEGQVFGDTPDMYDPYNADFGLINVNNPINFAEMNAMGYDGDASSKLFSSDEYWEQFLTCLPGNHSVRFTYKKNGDGHISEKDMLEISGFSLRVEDFLEHNVEVETTDVVFDGQIFAGKGAYLLKSIKFKNTGSAPLEILRAIPDGPFGGNILGGYLEYNQSEEVDITFTPEAEGSFEGTVVFVTNAGDVAIHCVGSTTDTDGLILAEDFEGIVKEWDFIDANNDGYNWVMGTSLWSINSEWVHSGLDCIGSNSYHPNFGDMEPDNYAFSPVVIVPDDGAMLRWYVASHNLYTFQEKYSVYIVNSAFDVEEDDLTVLEPVFTETLGEEAANIFVERTFDLSEYAGQDVRVVFRHYDCFGQYVLKIDDVFVYTMDKWNKLTSGIKDVEAASDVVSTEIYDINGIRINTFKPGVNIVRRTHADGSVKTSKIIVK